MKQTSPNDVASSLLASCPNGCTGATLLVEHDHSSETIVGLIQAGQGKEQAGGIEEAIEFAQINADQKNRWIEDDELEFIERIQDGIAAWDRLKQETGFDLRGVFRRRALVPFVLVPRKVAAKQGSAETLSMLTAFSTESESRE